MIRRLILSIFVCGAFASPAVAQMAVPVMQDETDTAGIAHSYDGGWEFFVGGGAAAFDCNADGFEDLYFAGGASPAGLFVNRSERGGGLRFAKMATPELELDNVTGAYPLDVDGDGLIDLAVLRLGENILFKGLGECRFGRANDAWGFSGGEAWSTSFSATWEAGKNWPTVAVGNYVDRSQPGQPWGTCHDNTLHRPQTPQDESFTETQALSPGHCALSILFSDWNRSGAASLRISNDRQYYRGGQEQLWKISDQPKLYGPRDGWRKLKIWGMGIATHDLTGDGLPEYYLTSMGDNKLRTLQGRGDKPAYGDLGRKLGVNAHRPFIGASILPSTGWHAQFEDLNNDGFIDLFVAKGNVHAMQDFALEDPNNLLLGSPAGPFTEVADKAGLASVKRTRGAVISDLNLDGMLDVVVVNREENVELWRNMGSGAGHPMGNWVALQLYQTGGNSQAVGSWIEVRVGSQTQRKEVVIGGGHASGQAGWHHFGIGVAERARVRVQWPDGEWGPWVRLFANQFARISRGKTEAALWLPPAAARAVK